MALYRVEVRKATQDFGGRKWCNSYYVDAGSASLAGDKATQIWTSGERLFHYEEVYCYEVYVNLMGDAPFTPGEIFPLDPSQQLGARDSLGQGDLIPEWNSFRVDFPVSGSRPSRKFYHPFFRKADVVGNSAAAAFLTDLGSGLSGLLGIPGLRDVDNEPWVGGATPRGVTSKRLGKFAAINVPPPPSA